ncbi:MAG: phage late control D family protein [Proteobacteria bacterium]|nr:phage late control D family protein [Pseudomonadota bacterium]
MEFEELARKYANFYAPNYKILIDSKDIFREHFIEITNVSFDDDLERADTFTFSINDPKVKCLDSDVFEPGNVVEIKMGYGDQLATMIVGEITSLRPNFPTDGTPQLEITGYDLSNQFRMIRKGWVRENKRDSEVVAEIARKAKHKLETQIKQTEPEHLSVVQPLRYEGETCTDYRFIKMLADLNSFEFFIKGRTLYFRKPRKEESEIVTLKYGTSLLSFNPEINIANQRSVVRVEGGRDLRTGQEIVGIARRGSEEARERGRRSGGDIVENLYGEVEERILDSPVYTQQEADTLARSRLNRLSEGLIRGSANCIGIPEIRAGENIKLEGLGEKFSRKYYIERTTHAISNAGYSTTFNIKANTI